jgi:hypothetical protein
MKFYVYCLSDEATPALVEGLSGVAGAAPGLIRYGNLSAVASEFTEERIPLTRENVEAHNRVNAHLLAHTTPLPFRFGTLVAPQQLDAYVHAHEAALAATLERVRGAVEMSLKIIWDAEAERREAEQEEGAELGRGAGAAAGVEGGGGASGAGTAFLAAKRREMAGDAALESRAGEIREWLAENLGDTIREERVMVNASQALVVRAAHLVERVRLEEYRERLRRLREERRARLRFLTSGAWPPYSFSEA